jgi:hypothetical protein
MKAGTTAAALFLSLLSRLSLSVFATERTLPPKTRLFSHTIPGWNLLSLVWIRNPVNRDYEYGPESRVLVLGFSVSPSGLAPDVPHYKRGVHYSGGDM